MNPPSPLLDEIAAVLAAASSGDFASRVTLPGTTTGPEARVAIWLNALLDRLAARTAATEAAARRLHALAEASRAFAEDLTETNAPFERILRRISDFVQGTCTLNILSLDGSQIESHHIQALDPAIRAAFPEMKTAAQRRLAAHPLIERVVRTGEGILIREFDLERLHNEVAAENVGFIRDSQVRTLVVVALRAQGRSVGTLGVMRHGAQALPLDALDFEFAQNLADRAALAIDNARAQHALRESEDHYRLMFDQSPLPKWLFDRQTLRFREVNDAALALYGYSRDEFLAMTIEDIRPPEDVPRLHETLRTPERAKGVWQHRRRDGSLIQVDITAHTFTRGGATSTLAVCRDVTEQLRLEDQLRQTQKLEAIGQLAAGVAHDFNNLLSVVLSCGQVLEADLATGDPRRENATEILAAGRRAAELTRQLLTFSRRQPIAPRVIELGDLISNLERLLRRTVGEHIELVWTRCSSPLRVFADPGAIDQVILNLAVNARDAMPQGGRLTIETAPVELGAEYVRSHLGAKVGPHVMLAITDTGTGMDRATQARIFEPFFTTKPREKGTGLGLATVHGIVQRSQGSIWVYSEPGKGSTFKVYLPAVEEEGEASPPSASPSMARGSETILLVEDDDQVRAVAKAILLRAGYQVLPARRPSEALLIAESHAAPIHLLLSDVVMPEMGGPQLARRLTASLPHLRVLCMSGYTDETVSDHGLIGKEFPFLQKPLMPERLLARVREVLDGPWTPLP